MASWRRGLVNTHVLLFQFRFLFGFTTPAYIHHITSQAITPPRFFEMNAYSPYTCSTYHLEVHVEEIIQKFGYEALQMLVPGRKQLVIRKILGRLALQTLVRQKGCLVMRMDTNAICPCECQSSRKVCAGCCAIIVLFIYLFTIFIPDNLYFTNAHNPKLKALALASSSMSDADKHFTPPPTPDVTTPRTRKRNRRLTRRRNAKRNRSVLVTMGRGILCQQFQVRFDCVLQCFETDV